MLEIPVSFLHLPRWQEMAAEREKPAGLKEHQADDC